jgi:hypothetical protein
MVLDPSVQLAGHTSPYLSVNWKALMRRMVSSTERPTGRSLTVICLFRINQTVISSHSCQGKEASASRHRNVYAPQDTLRVDDEEPTESDAGILEEDTVVARDLHVPIGNEGEGEIGAKATLLAGLGGPGEVRVLGVGGDSCRKATEGEIGSYNGVGGGGMDLHSTRWGQGLGVTRGMSTEEWSTVKAWPWHTAGFNGSMRSMMAVKPM